jgi:phosphoribosylformimino-5-aminoimidazole carboxamide ribotide isomerase
VVDLDGARDGTQGNAALIGRLVQTNLAQLQVGGGLRNLERVQSLLALGVQRAVVGSVAVNSAQEVISWSRSIDPDRLVLAFDVRIEGGVPWATTHGWVKKSELSLWQLLERYEVAGFKHVLCTDIERDGALTGPNVDLYKKAVARFPNIQWQASGGVASARDLHELRDCGVAAVISGKALLEKKISPEELRPFLRNASSPA